MKTLEDDTELRARVPVFVGMITKNNTKYDE